MVGLCVYIYLKVFDGVIECVVKIVVSLKIGLGMDLVM